MVDNNQHVDPQHTVVVATGNAHKLSEIQAILGPVMPGMRFISIKELGDFEDSVEDGADFYENALIKARDALTQTGLLMAVADDSGLVVDALDGAPGIYSARWAGEHGNDDANNDKLLHELEGVPEGKRTAHFHSSVVLILADGRVVRGDGDCPGRIGFERRGAHGFGYDPLFLLDDIEGRTMADLLPEEKNIISHRYRALMDLAAKLG